MIGSRLFRNSATPNSCVTPISTRSKRFVSRLALGWVTALNNPTSGDVESKTIDKGSSLTKTMVAVPPGNVAVVEVALAVEYKNDSGNIEADFESGSFLVFCPVVVVSLLNSPPVPLVAA